MKKKPKMPRPEPESWTLGSLPPVEVMPKKESPEFLAKKQIEEGKLQRTRDFGGLVPEPSRFLENLCSKIGPVTHD